MRAALLVVFACGMGQSAQAWGRWGHNWITLQAVAALPTEMRPFFKQHLQPLLRAGLLPDRRRYADAAEAPRHYIDLDSYGLYPFTDLPPGLTDALALYGTDTVVARGLLPWQVLAARARLVRAMQVGHPPDIMRAAGELCHYLADAHVPLHTTHNYDGQQQGWQGIHRLWESFLPEKFGAIWPGLTDSAQYEPQPQAAIWAVLRESHALLPRLYTGYAWALQQAGFNTLTYAPRGRTLAAEPGSRLLAACADTLNRVVAGRLKHAAQTVANWWYSAWLEAGQPLLGSPPAVPPPSGAGASVLLPLLDPAVRTRHHLCD